MVEAEKIQTHYTVPSHNMELHVMSWFRNWYINNCQEQSSNSFGR